MKYSFVAALAFIMWNAAIAQPVVDTRPANDNTDRGASTAIVSTAFINPKMTGFARVGFPIFPIPAAPAFTTATGTTNSYSVTVANATGLAPGMVGYGRPISKGCYTSASLASNFIVSISGLTLTMKCPNTSTSTAAAVQYGIQRNDPAATIATNTVMAREVLLGGASQGATTGWLGQIVTGYDYPATGALKIASSPGAPGGLVVGARTSDATNGASTYPIVCLYLADTWAATRNGDCAYFQSNLLATTAGYDPHIQAESSVNSLCLRRFSIPSIPTPSIPPRFIDLTVERASRLV